ncbi:succinylglutamate desuccinylase/aspartoacylase family protein [Thalassobaculum sp. OXR-137]|uniref:succinylglutamate desuccinylase/aspartoacylase family protein n=1 Tax=Thalassobaculum sp. OXR-137 TaxID=3100173 RepID=UPI002AC9C850|nr:succinylglutamate desuccinylase/aspartoacylase family protein [Thalassobaculum sp. OXR-137]WPZ36371.1 succinylglutamate desuccinylase/aspartoacylase family protein [Thalassobaculum sp. OXR-137]
MTRIVSRFPLPPMSLGTERYLTVHTYGDPDATPKAYIQAAVHAGELAGSLALHHLIRRLDAAEHEILGHIMLVPIANPIGLSQVTRGNVSGRFAEADGANFNRGYPAIAGEVANAVRGRLSGDAAANVALVREVIADILADRASMAETEIDYLRITLMRLGCDADLALDLHCEEEGLVHLYLDTMHWPQASDLPRLLGSEVTLLTNPTGAMSYDEALTTPWRQLDEELSAAGMRAGCLCSTVELRGAGDVGDALAEEDADRLYRTLQRYGIIDGGAELDIDTASPVRTVPVEGMERVQAPTPGIISFRVPLGAEVTEGQPIADLIDPTADDPAEGRTELFAESDGIVYARRIQRFAPTGATVAKIASNRPVTVTSSHLTD